MALPQLSSEERAKNLAKAAEMRSKRSALKDDIKAGKISLEEIFAKADDPVIGRMKVIALLESLPGFGKAKSTALMERLGISPTRRIQGLGARQREELIKALS